MKRLLLTLTALLCMAMPATVFAYNPLDNACGSGGGVNSSAACSGGTDNPFIGPNGVLKKVSLVLAFVAGVTAVIIIMLGGFNYVNSGGDPKKMASARGRIIGAVVGLVIIASGETIVIFVVSRL